MEVKKSPKADLEKGKAMGVLMGMIVGLAVLFVGFEWSDREITIVQDQGDAGARLSRLRGASPASVNCSAPEVVMAQL